jgi:chemotaxis protein MotB
VDGDDDDHEEHVNHEAWVIPYADMVTLLMALFLMLFAISSVDLAKFRELADGLRRGLGGGSSAVATGGEGVLESGESLSEGAGPAPVDGGARAARAEEALRREEEQARAAAAEEDQLQGVEATIREYAEAGGVGDAVKFRREARGLVVTIVADKVMFDPGQAAVRPEGAAILRHVTTALQNVPNAVAVEGHTDDVPINNSRFRSNWELSTARATEVLRYLVDDLGLPARRVSASGYGEQRPIDSNASPAGRAVNRRVELVVLSQSSTGATRT